MCIRDRLSSANTDLHKTLKDYKDFETEVLSLRKLNHKLTENISYLKNIEQEFCNLNIQLNEKLTQNNKLSDKLKALENDICNINSENTGLKEKLQSTKELELIVGDLTRQNSTLHNDVAEKVKYSENLQNEISLLEYRMMNSQSVLMMLMKCGKM